MNKVFLLGNIGDNPIYRDMGNNKPVAHLSLATDYRGRTEWHKIVCFDQLAEFAREYLTKGDRVLIEGRLETRKWMDKNGIDRHTTEIIASALEGIK